MKNINVYWLIGCMCFYTLIALSFGDTFIGEWYNNKPPISLSSPWYVFILTYAGVPAVSMVLIIKFHFKRKFTSKTKRTKSDPLSLRFKMIYWTIATVIYSRFLINSYAIMLMTSGSVGYAIIFILSFLPLFVLF